MALTKVRMDHEDPIYVDDAGRYWLQYNLAAAVRAGRGTGPSEKDIVAQWWRVAGEYGGAIDDVTIDEYRDGTFVVKADRNQFKRVEGLPTIETAMAVIHLGELDKDD